MKKTLPVICALCILAAGVFFIPRLADAAAGDAVAIKYEPMASGTAAYSGGGVTLDASNTAEGYVMIKYSGSNTKVKLQITRSGGTTYTYNLNKRGSYEVFPLTQGDGSYTVNVFENISGDSYSSAFGQQLSVKLRHGTLPFLYPNQYVNFNSGSKAVEVAAEVTASCETELEIVQAVYNYVTTNITYDQNRAATVKSGYLPVVDTVLAEKKGICFDYASLMTAMLRSQNIPSKLNVGYVSGGLYHAWISTYITDIGWVNDMIYFDGQHWKLMDPTFAAGDKSDSMNKFIGNTQNYSVKYEY